jgi:hypothetical protein
MDCEVRVSGILLTYFSQRHRWDVLRTPAMQENKHWLLRIYTFWILRPDIKLQAILRDRVVVLCCKVLPNTRTGRLIEVGKAADWWLVRWTVGRLLSSVVKVGVQYYRYQAYPFGGFEDRVYRRNILLRCSESQFANRRFGVSDSQELGDIRSVRCLMADPSSIAGLYPRQL